MDSTLRLNDFAEERMREYMQLPEKVRRKSDNRWKSREIRRQYKNRMQSQKYALSKAGLYGKNAEANCPLGRLLAKKADEGRGAFLFGECGVGKTFAAACATRLYVLKGLKAKLISAADYLQELKDEFGSGEDSSALFYARYYDLLVLDDLGQEKKTEWSLEQLTALIDRRIMRDKVTIITSNYELGALAEHYGGIEGSRLASRIVGACDRCKVKGDDRRFEGTNWLSYMSNE